MLTIANLPLHLSNVLQVLAVWWHEDKLSGIVEVLDTPAGWLLKSVYLKGFCFGASSRGWSSVWPHPQHPSVKTVGDDLQLITYVKLSDDAA